MQYGVMFWQEMGKALKINKAPTIYFFCNLRLFRFKLRGFFDFLKLFTIHFQFSRAEKVSILKCAEFKNLFTASRREIDRGKHTNFYQAIHETETKVEHLGQ